MAEVAVKTLRVVQRAVASLGGGAFNGKIEAVAIPIDAEKLTFNANLKVWTGASTFVEYSPADDNGKHKVFTSIDALVLWLRGAYLDMTDLVVTISDVETITKNFVPPTDVLKDATSKKAYFTKLGTANQARLDEANLNVTRAVTAGWNAVGAHPAQKAIYDEYVAKAAALDQAKTYYTGRVAFYQSIITP